MKLRLSAFLIALAVSPAAFAQRPDPAFEGPRGAFELELSMGEPVSFFLEWSRELELNEPQRLKLMAIRRRLRTQNSGFNARLDSIASAIGVSFGERGRMSEKQRAAIAAFNKLAAPTLDSIRANNDVAKNEVDQVLESFQLVRADSIKTASRKQAGPARRPTSDRR